MYAETELMFPYFHYLPQETQQLEEFYISQKSNAPLCNLGQISTISEYDLGGEGDLFRAPEPTIEDPVAGMDPITSSISMISCREDSISSQALNAADIESIQREQLLSEIFYECKKDLLSNETIETPFSDVLDIKVTVANKDENMTAEEKRLPQESLPKSVSSGCLSTMEWVHGDSTRPNFVDFPGMDIGAFYGMRRAFSEGDIKGLDNGNVSLIHSIGQPQIISNCTPEDRSQKLLRYRIKKSKRNFGRKIKYACRKALADSQPRIRGRFAKTEVSGHFKEPITA